MYEAKVTVTTKGRKNDLPVKTGDIISIIRTTNCPKGKWLARDSSNNCKLKKKNPSCCYSDVYFTGTCLDLTEDGNMFKMINGL